MWEVIVFIRYVKYPVDGMPFLFHSIQGRVALGT